MIKYGLDSYNKLDISNFLEIRTDTSSKGNQNKFYKDGHWVKLDFLGYESLSEVLAYEIIKNSNIPLELQLPYGLGKCTLYNQTYNCCISPNFLNDDEELITLHRILVAIDGVNYANALNSLDIKSQISKIVDTLTNITSLKDFGCYLTLMLELDAFTLNEDRHFNNIGIIKTKTGYRYMPMFDNGLAFCSDITYTKDLPANVLKRKIKSKPFSTSFRNQVSACQELYGKQLKITLEYDLLKQKLVSVYNYDKQVLDRVLALLDMQITSFKNLMI